MSGGHFCGGVWLDRGVQPMRSLEDEVAHTHCIYRETMDTLSIWIYNLRKFNCMK